MKTSEPKTASVTSQAKVNQPFFSKEGEGSFFGESVNKESSFFKPSSAYRVNSNGVLQTKLAIGQPNDKYEKEADTMADKVVQRLVTQEPITKKEPAIQTKPLAKTITPLVQPKCAACEQEEKLQKKDEEDLAQELPLELRREPIFESNAEPPDDNSPSVGKSYAEALQRKCAECEKEEKLQTKSDTASPQTASSSIESNLSSAKGNGSPMPAATRTQMEDAFGADFSDVRIHNDSSAAQMSKDLHAHAFTHGSDIYFNSGKYDTNSTGGNRLLTHELTHVVQQEGIIRREDVCEPIVYDEEEQVCRPSEMQDYMPAVQDEMESDNEFWILPPGMRQRVKPILDEETNQIIGFKYGGSSYWEIYDLEGNMIDSGEAPLESPLIDPIDLLAGGLGGLGRSLFRSTVRSTGRSVVGSVARGTGASIIKRGLVVSLTAVGKSAATAMRATYRAIKFRGALNFTITTASRMASSARRVPLNILKIALKYGKRVPDTQGVVGTFKYTIPMFKNGIEYTLEVVIRESDNTILHFLYK